ncbi:hypothetical protein [Polynucleobacter sp. MWH-UH35A]|nr:hypothetical protein [Polynucleobacter sp. MWH-UH35A]
MSETAPMLQKPVFCITAPRKKVMAKVAQRTDLLKELISTTSMASFLKD